MASKALKGLTIKFGSDTSELTKSLEKVEKQGRSLSSELGQINKLLKMDPKNTELLAQKQKVLADAISTTEKKLDTLKEAEKQVQAQFERGEVSEAQYRALQREIIETEAKLGKYKNAARETADAVEELGKETDKAADKIDEQAEKTEEAEKATEDLDDASGDLAAGGLAAVAAAAAAAAAAVVALAEESREYRTLMGKLDTAFKEASFSAEAATKTYESLQGILGETDQAVEAANFLAKLCTTEEELAAWTEIAAGVYATFGAALPIEGLTEAANETMRAGQVTGPFADALNWAAKEGETFGVTLKKNTKANEEWNNAVKEAKTAEDFFNLALQECSTEQERQQLITKTLTGLYGSAAKQYKKTNAEVIRANEATEKWNKATAKIGKAVEPVVTDIKELGVALLEDAGEPLEDIAKFIQKEVLPAIKDISSWVKKNMPAIKSGLVGVTTALVAFKVASIATTVAQKGLKGAIVATTVAQKALALAQAATPWGLIAAAVIGVTAAVVAYKAATKEARQPTQFLTDEEIALMEASREATEAFREQEKATQEMMGGILAEMDYVSDLASELETLADKKGKVKKEDEARVQFILGELAKATGKEYELVDGTIKKYDDLKKSIQDVIAQKTANALLEAVNADFTAALQAEAQAWDAMQLAQKQYDEQLALTQQKESEYETFKNEYNEKLASGYYAFREAERTQDELRLQDLAYLWEVEQGYLDDRTGELNIAAQDYYTYSDKIITYEQAQEAAAQGNYQAVRDILAGKGNAFSEYSGKVDTETNHVLASLQKEAVDAGRKAKLTKDNFEAGVEGYTEEMVKEAEEGYEEALDEFANAYADSKMVGEDLADGMTDGAESKRSGLLAKARSLVSGFLKAARDEADSHSPSRKAIAIFEDIGEGAEIGVEKKTPDVARAGKEQAAALLDQYRAQEINAQRSLRNIAEQEAARQTAGQMTAATANSGALDAILAAIKEGQVLLLDGDAVVGGTANKMDSRLGQLRVLAARGAR